MTKLFNKKQEQEKRRYLRKNTTAAEKLVWIYLRKRQVCGERFLRQYSIKHYVVDFYCPRLRLAVEIDGETHFEDEAAIQYDKDRQEDIESLGIQFQRFRNEEVFQNLDRVIDTIEAKVTELQINKGEGNGI